MPLGSHDEFVGMADLVAGVGYVWTSEDRDATWESVPFEDLPGRLRLSSTRDAQWIERLPQLRQEMRREIRSLQQQLGITMIYVTHDQTEAMSMADQVILLRNGSIASIGSAPIRPR